MLYMHYVSEHFAVFINIPLLYMRPKQSSEKYKPQLRKLKHESVKNRVINTVSKKKKKKLGAALLIKTSRHIEQRDKNEESPCGSQPPVNRCPRVS